MPYRRRMLIAPLACCVAAIAVPVVASAHDSHGHPRSHGRPLSQVQKLCDEVGVPLGVHPLRHRHGLGLGHGAPVGLSEAQLAQLKSACEKLDAAYQADSKSAETAARTFLEAAIAARKQLAGVCPPHHHHFTPAGSTGPAGPTGATGPTGPPEVSTACKEARKTYRMTLKEAKRSFRKALDEAKKAFQAALGEFETSAKPILETLETGPRFGGGHHHHHHHGFGPSGTSGPSGSTGLTGPTGPTGSTGASGATGWEGHSHH